MIIERPKAKPIEREIPKATLIERVRQFTDTEPEEPMCRYTEYDQETGETYGCSLPLGHKFKHQRGKQL